jgi:hypothetical protein
MTYVNRDELGCARYRGLRMHDAEDSAALLQVQHIHYIHRQQQRQRRSNESICTYGSTCTLPGLYPSLKVPLT